MSATINCKEFADYFAAPVQNKMKPAHVFEVPGTPYTVDEHYLEDLVHIHHGRVCGAVPGGGQSCTCDQTCMCWRLLQALGT